MSGGRLPEVTGSGVDQDCRESAVKVCLNKANRLHQRGDAYLILAKIIEEADLTGHQESQLWSLVAFND